MDRFEMVQKLVEKTGVSYADACEALDKTNGNLLDAALLLEENGKIEKKSGSYSTAAEASHENGKADREAPKPEITPDKAEKREARTAEGEKIKNFFRRVWRFLLDNRVIAVNNSGRQVINMPVLFAAILMISLFWLIVILLLISLIKGWQYSFEGPQLGNENVNEASREFGNTIQGLSQDIQEKYEEHKAERESRNS